MSNNITEEDATSGVKIKFIKDVDVGCIIKAPETDKEIPVKNEIVRRSRRVSTLEHKCNESPKPSKVLKENRPSEKEKCPRRTNTSRGNKQKVQESRKNDSTKIVPQTPYSLRRRIKKHITEGRLLEEKQAISDDSDTSFSPSSEESEDEIEDVTEEPFDHSIKEISKIRTEENIPSIKVSTNFRKFDRASKCVSTSRLGVINYNFNSDNYFTMNGKKKQKTSDNTLAQLRTPKITRTELNEVLTKSQNHHDQQMKNLIQKHILDFHRWMFYIREGYNLLLYGIGSKRNLLNKFSNSILANYRVLTVNGLFPELTVKDILCSLMNDIFKCNEKGARCEYMLKELQQKFKSCDKCPVFTIIHNIDGIALRSEENQKILSKLFSTCNSHLIASIDHINAPILWGNSTLSDFNFLWIDATTFEIYRTEICFQTTSLLPQSNGSSVLSSLVNVFNSLTLNAKRIFELLLKDHLDNKNNKSFKGVPFQSLYRSAREALLVTSNLALQTHLTEFLDHHIIKWKRDTDILTIPIETDNLMKFYQQYYNQDPD